MDPPRPPVPPSGLSSLPVHERWESLKDIIEHQYINENRKVSDLAKYMKDHHNFDAGVHQYKYQFKKWKLRKNVPSEAKNHIGRCLQTRAEAGRSSTAIQYQGHTVAPTKMRRYLKDRRRQDLILKGPTSGTGIVANAKLAFGKSM
ncbi:hypothetical protein BFW01_g4969 [Lasiodiplodia theobromae]|uniref:Clr5 domain-containing protein n=1 Tax=Lasiodiplodia theobromae TaxID=45133 RepID=A0A5N5D5Z2_9PEZI|nr:hypothetical protein DBV05_g8190 [Lasiodiplodia theobromae]KAF9634074.1 hypothetical protein BFW01_g4969 [Lasiodiplodia theobromae]